MRKKGQVYKAIKLTQGGMGLKENTLASLGKGMERKGLCIFDPQKRGRVDCH